MSTAMSSGRHRGAGDDRPRARHRVRRTIAVLAAVLSALLFAGFAYGSYYYNSLTSNQHQITISGLGNSGNGVSSSSASVSGSTVPHVTGTAENILIVGVDSRAGLSSKQKAFLKVGQNDQSTSTDTIIVVHVPANGGRATLLSIPRDTYVPIPGFQPAKINAAYADGYYNSGAANAKQAQADGASLLVKVVSTLTGLTLDHYVQVGFGGFYNIVKAIGDVPVDLCQSVDDTYQHNQALGISGSSGFKMSAGLHDLTAQQALEFVRQRHNIPGPVGNDLGREARQRYFLKQAFNKIATAGVLLNPVKLDNLVNAIDGAFTFDNRDFGILQFAEQMSQLTANHITGQNIPILGFGTEDGQSVIEVDPAKVQAAAHKLFYGAPALSSSSSSTSSSPSSTPSSSSSASKDATGGGDPGPGGCIY